MLSLSQIHSICDEKLIFINQFPDFSPVQKSERSRKFELRSGRTVLVRQGSFIRLKSVGPPKLRLTIERKSRVFALTRGLQKTILVDTPVTYYYPCSSFGTELEGLQPL